MHLNTFKTMKKNSIPPFTIFLSQATFCSLFLIFSKIMCENKQQNAFKMLSRQKILLIPSLPFFFLRRKKQLWRKQNLMKETT